MTQARSAVLLALSLAVAACSEDDEAKPRSYERVASFEESPLAILTDGKSVLVALPAELARIDAGGRTPVRLTDGRYRECPWDPAYAWGSSIDGSPRLTPTGDYITFSTSRSGTWAWPLAGGPAVSLVPANYYFTGSWTPQPPHWTLPERVRVVRDGDGWIAYGGTKDGVAFWSLGPDGSARDEIFRVTEDTEYAASSIAITYGDRETSRVHVDGDAIYVLVKPADRSVRRAVLGRIDRATKAWSEVSTWRREPGTPLDTSGTEVGVELAAVTPSHVLALVDEQIFRVPKTGGPPEPVGTCTGCARFVTDATHLYWFDAVKVNYPDPNYGKTFLRRAPLGGPGPVEDLVTLEQGERMQGIDADLAVTEDAIWWTMLEGPSNYLEKKPVLARLRKP